jgi:hypothetical protein
MKEMLCWGVSSQSQNLIAAYRLIIDTGVRSGGEVFAGWENFSKVNNW